MKGSLAQQMAQFLAKNTTGYKPFYIADQPFWAHLIFALLAVIVILILLLSSYDERYLWLLLIVPLVVLPTSLFSSHVLLGFFRPYVPVRWKKAFIFIFDSFFNYLSMKFRNIQAAIRRKSLPERIISIIVYIFIK